MLGPINFVENLGEDSAATSGTVPPRKSVIVSNKIKAPAPNRNLPLVEPVFDSGIMEALVCFLAGHNSTNMRTIKF